MSIDHAGLLGVGDPPPVAIVNPGGASPFLLIGDHAGNAVPKALRGLGLGGEEMQRHIAWDIGVRALGAALAARLDAVFIHQRYSRLVADCNRHPRRADCFAAISDGVTVPGNAALGAGARAGRIREIHAPYHAAIAWELARRRIRDRPVALVSLHSFTPAMNGAARPWHAGVLHDRGDASLARYLLDGLARIDGVHVGDNQPYRMDATDFTVPAAAYASRVPYVELELRQDEIGDESGVVKWADRLAALLTAWQGLPGQHAHRHEYGVPDC